MGLNDVKNKDLFKITLKQNTFENYCIEFANAFSTNLLR